DPRFGVVVGRRELAAVAAVAKARQYDLARARALRRHLVEGLRAALDAGEALPGIAPPRAVIDPLAHRFAELTIARDIDAELMLAANRVHDRAAQRRLERALVDRLAGFPGMVGRDHLVRAGQAADMAGQDMVGAGSHASPPLRAVAAMISPDRRRRARRERGCRGGEFRLCCAARSGDRRG